MTLKCLHSVKTQDMQNESCLVSYTDYISEYMSVHTRTVDTLNHCFSNCGAAGHWSSTKYYEK